MKTPKLSIIILSHNTKDILFDCLESVQKVKTEIPLEVIVSDNTSTDGSPEMVRSKFPWIKVVEGPNISFSNGNNRARKFVKGKYVLLLNSDTLLHKNTLKETVNYMESNKTIGALSCKLVLPNGDFDKDTRRRFPTPRNAFNRLFLGNSKDYWYLDMPINKEHEVDAIQGAFFLTRKEVLDKVGWLDENYKFDGEDLDLSFQIKKLGYKIIYYPKVSITHIKKATKNKVTEIRLKRKMEGINSMEYFVRKNLWNDYPVFFNYFVLLGIKFLKVIRFLQVKLQI